MKIYPSKSSTNSGNVLLLVVVVTAIVGFTLASYLTMVKFQNMTTMRSQAWNGTIPVIEAGIEEALAHLNANGSNDLAVDGWTKSDGIYWIDRSLGENHYTVTIANWTGPNASAPIVESRGYVKMPTLVASCSPSILFAASGSTSGTDFLERGVRVNAGLDALFAKGMVAKGQIDLNGNNITADSFDSDDPNFSTSGQYDPTKAKDNGHVATNSGLTNSVNVGNANIRGKISTGPGGSVAIGPGGSVGSKTWHDAGNTGIEPGWSTDDMNVDFPDVEAPFSGGAWTPSAGVVDGTTYNYVLGSGNFQMDHLSMNSGTMLVTGDAVLYVSGNLNISGNASIEIAPGASLKLFVGGDKATISGNGVINETGLSYNFYYYGMPSNTQLSLSGNSEFIGVIYAPNADFSLGGSGTGGLDLVGASITKTAKMNGDFQFHYDEALLHRGPNRGYIVKTWNEMTPEEVASFTAPTSVY